MIFTLDYFVIDVAIILFNGKGFVIFTWQNLFLFIIYIYIFFFCLLIFLMHIFFALLSPS